MTQRVEQTQFFCHRCQRHTVHQRTSTETNHILHLLLTIFCCGVWLPIWMLIIVVSWLEKTYFICAQCGQAAGDLTYEQRADISQQKKIDRQQAYKRQVEAYANLGAHLKSGVVVAIEELKKLPRRTDRVLLTIAGEKNDILLWFFRIIAFIVAASLIIGVFVGVISLLSSLGF